MKKKRLRLSEVYRLLEPGPVTLMTTMGPKGANVMTMSWHTMMEFEPPLIGCIISNRNFSFQALKNTRECVLNIPTSRLSKAVAGCGNCSGRNTDKFAKFGISPVPASVVKPPLIDECYANLECKVIDASRAEKYGLFVLEVVKAWQAPGKNYPKTLHHFGKGNFMIAGRTVHLKSKMK